GGSILFAFPSVYRPISDVGAGKIGGLHEKVASRGGCVDGFARAVFGRLRRRRQRRGRGPDLDAATRTEPGTWARADPVADTDPYADTDASGQQRRPARSSGQRELRQ